MHQMAEMQECKEKQISGFFNQYSKVDVPSYYYYYTFF